jgi:hypothetical protein
LKSKASSLPIEFIGVSSFEHRKLEFLCRIITTASECYRDKCKQTTERERLAFIRDDSCLAF